MVDVTGRARYPSSTLGAPLSECSSVGRTPTAVLCSGGSAGVRVLPFRLSGVSSTVPFCSTRNGSGGIKFLPGACRYNPNLQGNCLLNSQ